VETWTAHGIAAILHTDVEPDETGTLEWTVRMPREGLPASHSFGLTPPIGAWLMSPSPGSDVDLYQALHVAHGAKCDAPGIEYAWHSEPFAVG